jgi:hypothetical protein
MCHPDCVYSEHLLPTLEEILDGLVSKASRAVKSGSALYFLPVNQNIYIVLVVEADETCDACALMRRIWIIPNQIVMLLTFNTDRHIPVVKGRLAFFRTPSTTRHDLPSFPFVWTGGPQAALFYRSPIDNAGRREIIGLLPLALASNRKYQTSRQYLQARLIK